MFQGSLAVATQMLMSEEAYAVPGLRAALGRLANSVVAVLGPELSPGTDVYTKCKALIREVQVSCTTTGYCHGKICLLAADSNRVNMASRSTVMLSSSQFQGSYVSKITSILQWKLNSETPWGQEKRVSSLGRCSKWSSMAKSQLSDQHKHPML